MRSLRRVLRRLRHEQAGISLIELCVAMVVTVFVMGALLSVLDVTAKSAPRDQERSQAIREAQVGVHGMVRELRQATRILSTNPHWVEFEARLENTDPATKAAQPYVDRHILYSCGDQNPNRCVRYDAAKGAVLPATGVTVINRVLNWNVAPDSPRRVFSFPDADPIDPVSINIHIEVPAAGERGSAGYSHTITFDDGVTLRNLATG